MIYIREVYPEEGCIALYLEGALDNDSLPLLQKICEKHIGRRKIHLYLQGLLHVNRDSRTFLEKLRKDVMIHNLPTFIRFDDGN